MSLLEGDVNVLVGKFVSCLLEVGGIGSYQTGNTGCLPCEVLSTCVCINDSLVVIECLCSAASSASSKIMLDCLPVLLIVVSLHPDSL